MLERAAALAPGDVIPASLVKQALPPRATGAAIPSGSSRDLSERLAGAEREAILEALDIDRSLPELG